MKISESKLRNVIRKILKESGDMSYLYSSLDENEESDEWIADIMGQEISDVHALWHSGNFDDDQNPDMQFDNKKHEDICKEFAKQYKKVENWKTLNCDLFPDSDVLVGKATNKQIVVLIVAGSSKEIFITKDMI